MRHRPNGMRSGGFLFPLASLAPWRLVLNRQGAKEFVDVSQQGAILWRSRRNYLQGI